MYFIFVIPNRCGNVYLNYGKTTVITGYGGIYRGNIARDRMHVPFDVTGKSVFTAPYRYTMKSN